MDTKNYKKDFDSWNNQKKELDIKQKEYLFKTGDVWWCSVGANIAQESCGKGETFRRPVLVIKKLSHQNFIGVPLSTQKKEGTWFAAITIDGETQYALLYQIRMYSANRLQRRLTSFDDRDFSLVKEKLEALLELSDNHQS